MYMDVQASQQANGRRQQILLAEIKCFPDRNNTTREVYIAIGQYIFYRAVLSEFHDTTPLYLAIPEAVYIGIFDVYVRRAIVDNKIKLLIVNIEKEQIVQWIE